MVHECVIARGAPAISYLLFANDYYLFIRATETEKTTMKAILLSYEKMSGQAINFNKFSAVFSPNTTNLNLQVICQKLGTIEVSDPGEYLGMPMRVGRRKIEIFQFLKEKVKQKFHGWRGKCISKKENIILLKMTVEAIPNFWMNLLLIP